jgi:hypothetical protein
MFKYHSVESIERKYPQYKDILQKVIANREKEINKEKFEPKGITRNYGRNQNSQNRQRLQEDKADSSKSVPLSKETDLTWEGLEKVSYADLKMDFKNKAL